MPDYVNAFKSPSYAEETITANDGSIIGTIRIKPSGVLWKPANAHKFYSVPLNDFIEWITNPENKFSKTNN